VVGSGLGLDSGDDADELRTKESSSSTRNSCSAAW
jgi:hypothetical protein